MGCKWEGIFNKASSILQSFKKRSSSYLYLSLPLYHLPPQRTYHAEWGVSAQYLFLYQMNLSFLRDLVTEKVSSDSWLPNLFHSIPLGWQSPRHCLYSVGSLARKLQEQMRNDKEYLEGWTGIGGGKRLEGTEGENQGGHRRKMRAGPRETEHPPLFLLVHWCAPGPAGTPSCCQLGPCPLQHFLHLLSVCSSGHTLLVPVPS